MISIRRVLTGLAMAGLLAPCWAATWPPAAGAQNTVFAVVDGTEISIGEFEGMLSAAVRQKFYHRRPPEDELAVLRVEVTDRMVGKVLLLKEAQRRGIQPDEQKVRAEVEAYEQRVRDQPQWQENREQILPALTRALQEKGVIEQLEALIRTAPEPTEAALRTYYEAHPALFTEPERLRLSMVLLKVDPASPGLAWEQALERAQDLARQLANGADFAGLAQQHSDDSSAREGGDLGYRHLGMLPPGIEKEIDKMAVGTISEPIRLLEGIALFGLTERKPAQLRSLDAVRSNVAELWAREQGETRWRELLARLRADAEIRLGSDRRPDAATDGGVIGGQAAR